MPELPEVERAREVIEAALDRRISSVDDSDEWVCRPHRPGDIARALHGGRLVAAHRRGKTMWCDTDRADGGAGPRLGVHLGMSGWIVVETRCASNRISTASARTPSRSRGPSSGSASGAAGPR